MVETKLLVYNLKTDGYGDLTPQGEIPYPVINILTKHYKMNKDKYNNIYLENRLGDVSHLLPYDNIDILDHISRIITKCYHKDFEIMVIK